MIPLALLEHPSVFGFTQTLNPMTVGLYRRLVRAHVRVEPGAAILDVGCGVGAHRPLFTSARYIGIDINPAYVEAARAAHGDMFRVMDAGALEFANATFDAVFTVATCHHLDDTSVLSMVSDALRVLKPGGALHVIDPVWPVSSRSVFKRVIFGHDRGRHQRTVAQLTALLARQARVSYIDLQSGVLHDVYYGRLTC
jgi:SAM-dependent methyltransferase